jgi:hypothetical protein
MWAAYVAGYSSGIRWHQGFSRSNMYRVAAGTQSIHIQKLRPENKGVSPYIPLQAHYRSKKTRFNPYMIACNSIGYFPRVMWPSTHSDSLSFISLLCCPLPLLPYQSTDLLAFFLDLLPAALTVMNSVQWSSSAAAVAQPQRRIWITPPEKSPQQPCKPGEYMSWYNTWPVGGCMIQSMAVWRSQQGLSCKI